MEEKVSNQILSFLVWASVSITAGRIFFLSVFFFHAFMCESDWLSAALPVAFRPRCALSLSLSHILWCFHCSCKCVILLCDAFVLFCCFFNPPFLSSCSYTFCHDFLYLSMLITLLYSRLYICSASLCCVHSECSYLACLLKTCAVNRNTRLSLLFVCKREQTTSKRKRRRRGRKERRRTK